MARNYSSISEAKTLTANVTNVATQITLNNVTGLPSPPYVLVLSPDTASEEAILVDANQTGVISPTLNVTRAIETGAIATTHTNGNTVKHMIVGSDLQLSQNHIDNTTTAHGATGAVVGTTNTQTLTNKTINSASNTLTVAQSAVTNLVSDLALKASISSVNSDLALKASISSVNSDLALKAPLASPTFTGTPTLPTGTIATTQVVTNDTTAIATTAFVQSKVAIPTYNAQTGATYTFVLADVGKTVTASNANPQTYTIPPQASVTWLADTTLYVLNLGAGVVTFAAGAGVTVTNTAQTLAQYQSARLVRTGLNAWTVTPDSGQTSGGLTLIKTQTIGTTVSSVNVTDAFSATYENYKIIINGGVSSADCYLGLALGASVTAYSRFMIYGAFSANTVLGNAASNASSWVTVGDGQASQGLYMNVDLLNPFLAKYTRFGTSMSYTSADGSGHTSGIHKVATSYSDFTVTPSTGTMTGGTIYVYGYNK